MKYTMTIGFEDIKASILAVRKNLLKCFALAVIFFILGIALTINASIDNLYSASTSLYIPLNTDYKEASEYSYAQAVTKAATNYTSLIKSQRVAERAVSFLGNTDLTYRQVQNMTSYNLSATDMTITVISTDPNEAVAVVGAVANAYIEEIRTMTGMDIVQVLTSDVKANLAVNGLSSLWKKRVMFFVAGFAIMAVAIFIIELLSDKIRSAEQCLIFEEDRIIGILPDVRENYGK